MSCTRGAPDAVYSKLRVFDPSAIDEVNFAVGGHSAVPSGRLVLPATDELVLLHYKHLGIDYALERNTFLQTGRRALDSQNSYGFQYEFKREDYEVIHRRLSPALVDLADPMYVPSRDHTEPRWWRAPVDGPLKTLTDEK